MSRSNQIFLFILNLSTVIAGDVADRLADLQEEPVARSAITIEPAEITFEQTYYTIVLNDGDGDFYLGFKFI